MTCVRPSIVLFFFFRQANKVKIWKWVKYGAFSKCEKQKRICAVCSACRSRTSRSGRKWLLLLLQSAALVWTSHLLLLMVEHLTRTSTKCIQRNNNPVVWAELLTSLSSRSNSLSCLNLQYLPQRRHCATCTITGSLIQKENTHSSNITDHQRMIKAYAAWHMKQYIQGIERKSCKIHFRCHVIKKSKLNLEV